MARVYGGYSYIIHRKNDWWPTAYAAVTVLPDGRGAPYGGITTSRAAREQLSRRAMNCATYLCTFWFRKDSHSRTILSSFGLLDVAARIKNSVVLIFFLHYLHESTRASSPIPYCHGPIRRTVFGSLKEWTRRVLSRPVRTSLFLMDIG